MNLDFKKCLDRGKIKPFKEGKGLVEKEIGSAERDLKWAKMSFEQQNFKWGTIQAYYSMFHAARALIYSEGYREASHYCLLVALKALFVEKDRLFSQLVDDFHTVMVLRENADYEDDFSSDGAKKALQSAEEFVRQTRNLIGE